MNRAFVHEAEPDAVETVPERPVSRQPNFVTLSGLRKIDVRLHELEAQRHAAAQDAGALAAIEREVRYWRQRRGSARVIEPPTVPTVVRFGVTVRVRFEDGTERTFRIVGEDEADPAGSLLSWTSPLATALIGCLIGDSAEIFGRQAVIVGLSA